MPRTPALVLLSVLIVSCSPNAEVRDGSMASAASGADSVVLQRSVCFGSCPAYRLRIAASGAVLFQPENPGGSSSTDSISVTAFQRLVAELDRAKFDSFPDVIQEDRVLCAAPATDHPSSTITVFRASAAKQVRDYTGCYAAEGDTISAARLVTLRKLDELVDSTARSARWVRPLEIR